MSKTPTPRRVYAVHHAGTSTTRLVRAVNVATAVRHVVRTDYTAEVASQDDLIDLLSAGTRVEDAGADDGEPPVKVLRFTATSAEPPPERDPRVPDMFDDVPLPTVPTVISREPDPETVDAAHEAERRDLAADHVEDVRAMVPEAAAADHAGDVAEMVQPLAAEGFAPCGRALGGCGKATQACGRDGCGVELHGAALGLWIGATGETEWTRPMQSADWDLSYREWIKLEGGAA